MTGFPWAVSHLVRKIAAFLYGIEKQKTDTPDQVFGGGGGFGGTAA